MGRHSPFRQERPQPFCKLERERQQQLRRHHDEWPWHGEVEETPAADGPAEWLWDQK